MDLKKLKIVNIKAIVPAFHIDTIAKIIHNTSRDGVQLFEVSDTQFSSDMITISLKKEHLEAISYEEKTYAEFEDMVKGIKRKGKEEQE